MTREMKRKKTKKKRNAVRREAWKGGNEAETRYHVRDKFRLAISECSR